MHQESIPRGEGLEDKQGPGATWDPHRAPEDKQFRTKDRALPAAPLPLPGVKTGQASGLKERGVCGPSRANPQHLNCEGRFKNRIQYNSHREGSLEGKGKRQFTDTEFFCVNFMQ